jgi:alkylation response protein AidB-like acyl-CoA dehydrogenase
MTDVAVTVEEFREEARAWLAANLSRRDSASAVPRGTRERTAEVVASEKKRAERFNAAGFTGITVPVEYGGRGLSPAHEQAFEEAAADYDVPRVNLACMMPMLLHGRPEFLRRTIPGVLAGEVWVQFFSEPEAGSDLAGIRTRATRDGDRWILNGSKIWSTGAATADYGMCLARTNWDVPKHRGLTWFAVRTDLPGLTIQPIKEISGGHDFCQEFIDDVELSDDDRICEVDEGWAMTQTMLVYERGGSLSGAGRGLPMPALERELAPDLVGLAQRVGRTDDPIVRQLIGRAQVQDRARAALGGRIGELIQAGAADPAGLASYGKLAAGTFDPIRARIAMEIGGTDAIAWEPGSVDEATPALNYLNGRIMSIAGGTNEMQRNGIGERVLGLPREPSFDAGKPFNEVIRNASGWTGKIS